MMSNYSVGFDIFAKDRASDVFDKVGNKVDGTGSRLGAFKDKAAIAGAVAGAAIVAFGKTSIDAYEDAAKSQRVLEDAYARFPALANVSIDALRAQAAALQNKTKFDGDDINAMQGSLAQYKLNGQQIQQLTPLVLDYAEKTGKDLATASQDVGKALLGQGRSLKEIGINFKDTGSTAGNFTELMGGLRGQVGGFAEKEGASAEGKAEILKNKFGDLQESIGEKLLPAATKLTDWLSVAVGFISDNSTAIGALVAVVGTVLGVVKLWTIAQGILNVVLTANPIGIIIVAVAALAAGVIWVATQTRFFQTAWRVMTDALGTAWRWLWNTILAPIIRFVLNGFANMVGGISSFLRALSNIPGFGWAKTAADKMDGAADKARRLAAGIRDIPSYKQVDVSVIARLRGSELAINQLTNQYQNKQSALIAARAGGGPTRKGETYLVGEEGPELRVEKSDGYIINATDTARLMGRANSAVDLGGSSRRSDAETFVGVVQLVIGGKVIQEELLRLKRTSGGMSLGLA